MRRLAVALVLGCLSFGASAQAPAPPAAAVQFEPLPTTVFASLPFSEMTELSPDGTHIAGLFAVNGRQSIGIIPVVGDRSKAVFVGLPDLTEAGWIRWVGGDNIVIGLSALLPVETDNWYISRLIGINRSSGKVTKLLWDLHGQNAADLVWVPTDGSREILVAGQDSIYESPEFWPSVYRVDVATGHRKIVMKGRGGVMDWGADTLGRIRYGVGYRDDSTRATLFYRGADESGFRAIDRASLRDDEALAVPVLFVPGTDNGVVYRTLDDGRTVLAEVDLPTGKLVRTVAAADQGNVVAAIPSPDGSRLLGFYASDDRRQVNWLDPAMARSQEALNAMSPASRVVIDSYSNDLSKMLVRIGTSDNPGLLYYYDAATDSLTKLAAMNDEIGGKRLSRAKMIRYKARDGLEIEGVLTMPRGRAATGLPFIVMPHGGPWGHDELAYDYWAQFLAERGYAVLQPNFRGSTGYGAAFEDAGEGQLGFAMQDDVTDGVRWAIGQKIADPKRVCIVGASYGGYAAMWGIVKDPDLYRCAISIAGVSNLRREVNDFGGTLRAKLHRIQWQKMTPDFAAVSPINAVDRIKTPLLLIHGKKDVTVDHNQSTRMVAAMTKAGKPVDFVSLPLADHYFTREADRLLLLQSIEAFLAKHNPPD